MFPWTQLVFHRLNLPALEIPAKSIENNEIKHNYFEMKRVFKISATIDKDYV